MTELQFHQTTYKHFSRSLYISYHHFYDSSEFIPRVLFGHHNRNSLHNEYEGKESSSKKPENLSKNRWASWKVDHWTLFLIQRNCESPPSLSPGVDVAVSLFRPSLPFSGNDHRPRKKESFFGTSNWGRKEKSHEKAPQAPIFRHYFNLWAKDLNELPFG